MNEKRQSMSEDFYDYIADTTHRGRHSSDFTFRFRCLDGWRGVVCVIDNLLGAHDRVRAFPFGLVCQVHDRMARLQPWRQG